MKYMFTTSPLGYMIIVVKGRLDLDSAKRMIASAAIKAEKEEIFGFLFDFRDTLIDLRPSEISYLLDHMLNVGLLTLSKICFVYSQDEADYRHAANAGYNRGFKIRCYKRPEKALAWLIERPKSTCPKTLSFQALC